MLNSSPDTPVSSDDRNLLKCWVDYIVGLCKEPIRRHEELKAITRHNQAAVDALFPHTKAKVYRLIQCLRREPFRGEDERVCMNQQTQQTSSYGKYAVFIEPNGNIKCLIEGVATMFTPEQHRIRTLANFLNSFPCEGLHTPHHDAFKTMVGQIHVCAIERQIETGEALYEEALQYYRRRNVEAY